MPLFNNLNDFYNDYMAPLSRVLYRVSKRGLLTDPLARMDLQVHIDKELFATCKSLTQRTGKPVVPSAEEQKFEKRRGVESINLGSTHQLIELLKQRGLDVPRSRQTGRETTNEAKLFELYSKCGDEVLGDVLRLRELNKIKQDFLQKDLLDDVFFSDFVVGGTVTGRRSSRANIFDLGSNGQNIPKHSELSKVIRACFVARPSKIFLSCDQKGAEDWMVQGSIADVCGDMTGINELRAGINRHRKLAAFVFAQPESQITKDSQFYYLGKRARHANNYGIRAPRLSFTLASERILVPIPHCQYILDKTNQLEPNVRRAFQKNVESILTKTRTLITPIGRVRAFYGLRPYSDNSETFREGYAFVPQSTVGDNTGLAIVYYEYLRPDELVSESHDSMLAEVASNTETLYAAMCAMQKAFSRVLTFANGFQLEIPIEFEIGYNLRDMHTVTLDTLAEVYQKCQDSLREIGLASIVDTSNLPSTVPPNLSGGQPLLH